MISLALEASSHLFSVSLVKDNIELASRLSKKAFSASESCAIFVQDILVESKVEAKEIDRLIINRGPGSFTGLRVAHSFALGFSQAFQTELITVSAFELLFASQKNCDFAIIESKRDEVYLAETKDSINLVKKSDLSQLIQPEKKIICNKNDALEKWISNRIYIHEANAFDLARIGQDKKFQKEVPEILYFHHFEAKK